MQDLGHRSSGQLFQARMTGGNTMLADMLCQQSRCPQFLRVAQILGFLARQRHHPCSGFRAQRRAPSSAREILQGHANANLQSLGYAPLHSRPIRSQFGCYGRDRRAPVIPQQNLRTLNTACGFRTGLDQLLQHPNFLIAKHQLGAFAGEGHCGGPL